MIEPDVQKLASAVSLLDETLGRIVSNASTVKFYENEKEKVLDLGYEPSKVFEMNQLCRLKEPLILKAWEFLGGPKARRLEVFHYWELR